MKSDQERGAYITGLYDDSVVENPNNPQDLPKHKPSDREGERLVSIAGLNSQPINDHLRLHTDSKGEPQGLIELWSSDKLEEDLAAMEIGEHVLPESVRNQAVKDAFTKVLQEFGSYAPEANLYRLFPGLDKTHPENYEVKDSNIKVFILPDADYIALDRALKGTKQATRSGGFACLSATSAAYPLVEKVFKVNMAAKDLIVVAEGNPGNSYIGPIPMRPDIEKKMQRALEAKLIHEVVHIFGIGNNLPRGLREGVVEWYAQGMARGSLTDEDYFNESDIDVAYEPETEAVSILFATMMEHGVELETITRAFISEDRTARIQVAAFLADRYSREDATRVFDWDYINGGQALTHIVNLEARQNSELGEFLRTFADKDILKLGMEDYLSQ